MNFTDVVKKYICNVYGQAVTLFLRNCNIDCVTVIFRIKL